MIAGALIPLPVFKQASGQEVPGLSNFSAADFKALLGQEFQLGLKNGQQICATLSEVGERKHTTRGGSTAAGRKGFSLLWKSDVPFAQAGMVELQHPAIPALELFVIPVEKPRKGALIEAVIA